jgi:Zn ribbon nucleic-acid-binding protein
MIRFRCPACWKSMNTYDADAGAVVECVRCGQHITLPRKNDPLPALPPEDDEPKTVRVYFGDPDPVWQITCYCFLAILVLVCAVCGVVVTVNDILGIETGVGEWLFPS